MAWARAFPPTYDLHRRTDYHQITNDRVDPFPAPFIFRIEIQLRGLSAAEKAFFLLGLFRQGITGQYARSFSASAISIEMTRSVASAEAKELTLSSARLSTMQRTK
jgi:hypothetical protein